jgi:hypothetical protein
MADAPVLPALPGPGRVVRVTLRAAWSGLGAGLLWGAVYGTAFEPPAGTAFGGYIGAIAGTLEGAVAGAIVIVAVARGAPIATLRIVALSVPLVLGAILSLLWATSDDARSTLLLVVVPSFIAASVAWRRAPRVLRWLGRDPGPPA